MGLIKVTLRKINNACEDARLRPKAYKGTSSAGERAYAHALFIFLLFFVVGLFGVDGPHVLLGRLAGLDVADGLHGGGHGVVHVVVTVLSVMPLIIVELQKFVSSFVWRKD
mgnify:FL=1